MNKPKTNSSRPRTNLRALGSRGSDYRSPANRKPAEQARLWAELHPSAAPPIPHPIPRLNRAIIPPVVGSALARLNTLLGTNSPVRAATLVLLVSLAAATSGCTELIYTGPNGEHFSRRSFGSGTAISSLTVEAGTNGLRRVELRGYTNDSTQALGAVTEAAVRAALHSAP